MIYIIIMVVAVVFGFIVIVAIQPSSFIIQRNITIRAPKERIFPLINNLKKWDNWSPWAKLDPNMKIEYTGPEEGKGAGYYWTGNNKVGEGKMTIEESDPYWLVGIDLEFLRPMQARNKAEFTLMEAGGETKVVWSMTGNNNFGGKLFCLFVNMDKMVGKDFEKGLASLKSIAEAKS